MSMKNLKQSSLKSFGTWTATLPNGGTIDATTQLYTVEGDTVFLQFSSRLRSVPNNSNTFLIGGLPFVSNPTAGRSHSTPFVARLNLAYPNVFLSDNSSQIYFQGSTVGTGGFTTGMTNAIPASATNDFDISFSIFYRRA